MCGDVEMREGIVNCMMDRKLAKTVTTLAATFKSIKNDSITCTQKYFRVLWRCRDPQSCDHPEKQMKVLYVLQHL